MNVLKVLFGCMLLTSCTVAINLTHTEGTASDLIDETQTNDPDPAISIPISPIMHTGARAPCEPPRKADRRTGAHIFHPKETKDVS